MGRTSKGHTYVQGTYVGVRADATLTRSQRGTRACARVDTTPCCVSLRHIKMPINASRAECGPESPSLPRQEASQQKELLAVPRPETRASPNRAVPLLSTVMLLAIIVTTTWLCCGRASPATCARSPEPDNFQSLCKPRAAPTVNVVSHCRYAGLAALSLPPRSPSRLSPR